MTPEEWGIVRLTLLVGGTAVAATLPIAYALAMLLARGRFPGKLLLDGSVHLPLVVPPVVTGWVLLLLFAPAGPLGRLLDSWFGATVLFQWTGAAIAAGVMALPLMVGAIRRRNRSDARHHPSPRSLAPDLVERRSAARRDRPRAVVQSRFPPPRRAARVA